MSDGQTDNLLARIKSLTGLDRAILYTLLARVIGFFAFFVTLKLITEHLSEKEQGYYFCFQSLLGITVFFDLGLGNVLMLFASHEKAKLHWGERGSIGGDQKALSRLSSLFRFGNIWFGLAALVFGSFAFFFGARFFESHDLSGEVSFTIPWLMAVVVTGLTLFLTPLRTIFEGCCKVMELRLLGLIQPLISHPVRWMILIMGGGLFAGPAFWGAGLFVFAVWFMITHPRFVPSLTGTRFEENEISWSELWPLQWRTAVMALSSYFIYQLFNPMMFALRGPEAAGRMGFCLSLSMQISSVGLAWISTKVPQMGVLWARKDYRELDRLFFSALFRMLIITITGGAALIAGYLFARHIGHNAAERMMEPLPFVLLVAVLPFNNIVMSESLYLRANKKEVLIWISICYGALVVTSNLLLGSWYGETGMMAGYLIISVVNCIITTIVFTRFRRKWQKG